MILQNYISSECIYGEHRYIPEEYMDEKWWYIRGASGYMISDYGRVWSEKSQKFLKPKPLDDHGHMGVCLYVNGKCSYEYIHRLMAKAFIPNPMNLPVVRHLNDVPDDNDICNLKWGAQKDNIADSIKNEKAHFITDSEREIGLSKMRRPIVAIKIKTGEEVYFNGQNEASRFLGIQQSNIWKVLNGERRNACGYYFEYVRGDYHE